MAPCDAALGIQLDVPAPPIGYHDSHHGSWMKGPERMTDPVKRNVPSVPRYSRRTVTAVLGATPLLFLGASRNRSSRREGSPFMHLRQIDEIFGSYKRVDLPCSCATPRSTW